MKTAKTGILALLIFFAAACSSEKEPGVDVYKDMAEHSEINEAPKVSEEVIREIIMQIPSPLEISVMLKDAGIDYRSKILNAPENASGYTTSYEKSLALGIYGTDLGYTNIFEQSKDAVKYLAVIQELSNEMNIGQFFDYKTIKRLASSSNNLDSLLLITTQNFNNINNFLQEQQRSNLSVLLLAGGWIEALHIVLDTYQQNTGNEQLRQTIGEQQIILDKIVALLEFYTHTDSNINQLHEDLVTLRGIYDQVEIINRPGEVTTEVVDGIVVVNDQSSQEISISEQTIHQIQLSVGNIREKIIS